MLLFLVDAHCCEKRSPLLSWSTMIRLFSVSVKAEIVEYKFQQLGFGVTLLLALATAATGLRRGYGVAVAKLCDSTISLAGVVCVFIGNLSCCG